MAGPGKQNAAAKPGLVIWITGLPGVGKTVIAQALADILRMDSATGVVLLDGDEVRTAFGIGARYLPDERLALAKAYGRFCRLIANQGNTVICATVSMFDEVRDENRSECHLYFEVFIRASDELRQSRKPLVGQSDPENLVLGQDTRYQLPCRADLVLDNDGSMRPEELAAIIEQRLHQ